MNLSLDVEGLDEVVRKLHRVEQRVAVKFIRSALRYAVKPTIVKAKAIVPYDGNRDGDSYSLRDAIGVRTEKKKNRGGTQVSFRLGAHRETAGGDANGYAIKGGLGKSSRAPNYARIVNAETPFLLPALEATEGELLRRFATKLGESVARL